MTEYDFDRMSQNMRSVGRGKTLDRRPSFTWSLPFHRFHRRPRRLRGDLPPPQIVVDRIVDELGPLHVDVVRHAGKVLRCRRLG